MVVNYPQELLTPTYSVGSGQFEDNVAVRLIAVFGSKPSHFAVHLRCFVKREKFHFHAELILLSPFFMAHSPRIPSNHTRCGNYMRLGFAR